MSKLEQSAIWRGESGVSYELVRELGSGGMGQTWLVRRQGDDRDLVLKVLRMERADDWKAVELFEREMDVLEGLEIDGVPRFVDRIADAASGQAAFVQELAPGAPMQALIKASTPVPAARVEAWLRRALGIVAALHAHAPPIIHRDLSPANMLVDPARDDLSVIDLGAVKATLRDATVMTAAGTFGYMAPEQLLGRAVPASDLFGLGMAFTALAARAEPGELPADTDGRVDVTAALKHSGLSEPVQRALIAMTQPGLSQRPPDARSALALLDSAPVSAREDASPQAAPVARRRRHRWLVLALVACALGGLVASWSWALRPRQYEAMRLGGWSYGHAAQRSGLHVSLGIFSQMGVEFPVERLAFSPDGSALWSLARNRGMIVWDLKTGRPRCEWARYHHSMVVDDMAWSEDAKTLWTVADDGALYRYNSNTCAPIQLGSGDDVLARASSHGTRHTALLRGEEGALLRARIERLRRREREPGELMLTTVDATRTELLQQIAAPAGDPLLFVAAQDRKRMALGMHSYDGMFDVYVWDLDGDQVAAPRQLRHKTLRWISALALSPDSKTLAVLYRGLIVFIDAKTLDIKTSRVFDTVTENMIKDAPSLVFSPDGSLLAASVNRNDQILVFDVASMRPIKKIPSPLGRTRALAISPDNKRLASAGEGPFVWLWEI